MFRHSHHLSNHHLMGAFQKYYFLMIPSIFLQALRLRSMMNENKSNLTAIAIAIPTNNVQQLHQFNSIRIDASGDTVKCRLSHKTENNGESKYRTSSSLSFQYESSFRSFQCKSRVWKHLLRSDRYVSISPQAPAIWGIISKHQSSGTP